jgi:predicted cupin superfamily sugar epimerase
MKLYYSATGPYVRKVMACAITRGLEGRIRRHQSNPHASPADLAGHYRETWRDAPANGGRGAGTAILFLHRDKEFSRWHRVDAAELWIWQAGTPMALRVSQGGNKTPGPDLGHQQTLHGVVPAGAWQSTRPLGAWSRCSCVVTPAFAYEGSELAPAGWSPE